MNTQDILNIFIILALLTLIICSIISTIFLVITLKAVTNLAEDLKETAQTIKDKSGIKILAALPAVFLALIGRIIKIKRG